MLQQKAPASFEVGTFISISQTSSRHKTHEDLHKGLVQNPRDWRTNAFRLGKTRQDSNRWPWASTNYGWWYTQFHIHTAQHNV
jgi:hypothetical protein